MQPVFYILAIMGCGDGNEPCTPARVEPGRYATAAQCRAELPAALARNSDLSFPVLSADCRRGSPVTAAKANLPSTRG